MTKAQFLKQLERALNRLPTSERKDILYDYEEHIRSAMEQGVGEEEAILALGNPRALAKELLASYLIDKAETSRSIGNVLRAVLATIGLGFFNLVVVLGPFLGIVGFLVGLFGASIGLIAGPIAGLIGMVTGHVAYGMVSPLQATFLLLGIDGIGFLLLALSLLIAKFMTGLTLRYLRLNLRIIQGGHA